jgi:hypothetical protein
MTDQPPDPLAGPPKKTIEVVVARLSLPCGIRGLDVLCTGLEEMYGGPLYFRSDGTDPPNELVIVRKEAP